MRKLLTAALVIFVCCLTMSAQTAGTVSGTVRYADTGKAADGLRLSLMRTAADPGIHPDPQTGEYTVRDSDHAESRLFGLVSTDGKFVIHDVPYGVYLVHTYSASYLSPDDTIYPTSNAAHVATGPQPGSDSLRVEITAAHPRQTVDVALKRGGTIEGSVVVAGGTTLAGRESLLQSIAVSAERKLDANRYARVGGAAHLDSAGRYSLEGLGPGDYIVFFGRVTMVRMADGGQRGGNNLPIYAADTVRPSQATVVHVSHAEAHRLDFVISKGAPLHHVEGTVDVSGDNLLRSTIVRLYPTGEGGLTASMPLMANKGFLFEDVPDGDYTISVEFPPTQEFVSADVANNSVRMRLRKPAYAMTTTDVHVAGGDVNGVALRPVAQ